MQEMDKYTEHLVNQAVKKAVESIQNDFQEDVTKLSNEMRTRIRTIMGELPGIQKEIAKQLSTQLSEKVATLPHLKGDKGEPGEDGRDGMPGIDGVSPSEKEVLDMVETVVAQFLVGKKNYTEEEIKNIVKQSQSIFDPEKQALTIARALETLRGTDRLDYKALKNRPTKEDAPRGIIRGGAGGNNSFSEDISSQFDGITTTFTVPQYSRILAFILTGWPPNGVLRPTVDFTTPTNTTVALVTAQVTAPESGTSGLIIYAQ